MAVASATSFLPTPRYSLASSSATTPSGVFEEFGYGDVSLDSPLHEEQLRQTHAVLMGLDDDALMKPFPDHRGKRFHQCVIIEPHQHRMCLPQLFFMEWAIERDIPIAELFKHTRGSRCRRRRERISGSREKTRSRSYGHRLKKSSARDRRQ